MLRAMILALLAGAPLAAQSLYAAIDALLEQPEARRAIWGIHVRDLASGQTLFERNAGVPFTPASNTKLFSTALALLQLGPDHRFQTRVIASAAPDRGGRLPGDLVLAGGGDPSLSARAYPYQKGGAKGDPLTPLGALADLVVAAGVRRVDGDIVGDDTLHPWAPYPEGWTAGDGLWEYGAPVSALAINDNAFLLTVRLPRRAGEAVEVTLRPPVEYFTLHNTLRVYAGAPRRIVIDRLPGSRVLRIAGTAPPGANAASVLLAVDDPALYAATIFRQMLEQRGVTVAGEPRARHRFAGTPYEPPSGQVLASRLSPPLADVLQVVNKVSQNLHAEIVLRETARVVRGEGSAEAGLMELAALLGSLGVARHEHDFLDASGLSRKTLVTPNAITLLLRHMHLSGHGVLFRGLLPVSGEDGTLAGRFRAVDGASAIRAKTGAISHVSALSGFAGDPEPRVAFSIVVNHATAPASEMRAIIDKIAMEILRKATS